VTHPRIAGIGTANPSLKLTQQESFIAAGYKTERIRNIFLNSDIDYRHFSAIVDFESFLETGQIGKVGLDHRAGKLRIVLGAAVQHPAAPMIEQALARLFRRHGISMADIRFWVLHPGGRKVIDNVQEHFGLTNAQLHFSRTVLRNYGNMSSPTVMFVLDEVMRNGDPQPGDLGVMVALGPGMAAEVVLLRW
jgi:alkylresorcinol/alkylpyrone synthase